MVNLARSIETLVRLVGAIAIVGGATTTARPEEGRLLDARVTCTSGTLDDGARLSVEAVLPDGVKLNADDLVCQVSLRRPSEGSYEPYIGEFERGQITTRNVDPPYDPNYDARPHEEMRARVRARPVITAWFESDTCEGRRFSDLDFMDVKLVVEPVGQAPITIIGAQRISQTYACGFGVGRLLMIAAIVVVAGVVALVILLGRRTRRIRRASSPPGSVL